MLGRTKRCVAAPLIGFAALVPTNSAVATIESETSEATEAMFALMACNGSMDGKVITYKGVTLECKHLDPGGWKWVPV